MFQAGGDGSGSGRRGFEIRMRWPGRAAVLRCRSSRKGGDRACMSGAAGVAAHDGHGEAESGDLPLC